jgi:hypothetical protein
MSNFLLLRGLPSQEGVDAYDKTRTNFYGWFMEPSVPSGGVFGSLGD